MNLPKYAVRRPVTVVMAFIAVLLFWAGILPDATS